MKLRKQTLLHQILVVSSLKIPSFKGGQKTEKRDRLWQHLLWSLSTGYLNGYTHTPGFQLIHQIPLVGDNLIKPWRHFVMSSHTNILTWGYLTKVFFLDTLSVKNRRQKLEQQVRQAKRYGCFFLKQINHHSAQFIFSPQKSFPIVFHIC